jgi:tetratricopeptide (TPR) repeat protein
LLVLEDLHWADTSTLDLVVFLAHNLRDRRVLLLGTYRADESTSAARVRRLADGVRRSGSAMLVELGPLDREELTALLAAHTDAPPSAALTDAIVARAEGNPFFAEELLAAAGDQGGALPRGLRDLLLQRVTGLDPPAQGLLRVAAAAGRDVGYPLLRAAAALPEPEVRASLRQAVEHGVLIAVQATGRFRFRHALLAEAVYATLLPGEREELHGRLAQELARSGAAAPAELAPHWAAAGRTKEALAASVAAARQAEAVFGLAEALVHLERTLQLWDAVPDAAELVKVDLAGLCASAAEAAWHTGAAPRAVELARRAIELVGDSDPRRAALLHEALGRYLHDSGHGDVALAAVERAVELAPAQPPSPERALVLAILGKVLLVAWRYDESVAACEQALALARAVGAHQAEVLALRALGAGLAYLGRGDEGLAQLWLALQLAEERSDPTMAHHAYVTLTDVLTMLGRPRESARLAAIALDALHRYGLDQTTLVANQVEALVAIGEWDQADRVSAAALRAMTATLPHQPLIMRASVEVGRGEFDAARAHLQAAAPTVHEDPDVAYYDAYLVELALWERRWVDADEAVREGVARARSRGMAQLRIWLCAKGLRAQAELAALARARRDEGAVRDRLAHARKLLTTARRAATEAAAVTPNAAGWLALAEAEYQRARGTAAGAVGRRRRYLGAAGAPAAGGLLPLAAGRGAGRRRRLPRPGERAAQQGARRGGPDRRNAPAPRAGAARGTGAAGAGAAAGRATQGAAAPAGDPRPDPARGGGPGPAGPRLHQPGDRRHAGDQRQDRRCPRVAHPAQAGRAQPAGGGRHRPPPVPAAPPDQGRGSNGLSRRTPVRARSPTLRVTRVHPRTLAVAAINPSITGSGSGTFNLPHSSATSAETGTMRSL